MPLLQGKQKAAQRLPLSTHFLLFHSALFNISDYCSNPKPETQSLYMQNRNILLSQLSFRHLPSWNCELMLLAFFPLCHTNKI